MAGIGGRARALVMLMAAAAGLSGCETMKEHSVVAGAVIGAVGGAALGAALDSDDPGRGALIGAAAGAAVGAGAGYLAKRHFENVEARSEAHSVLSQEATNETWQEGNAEEALPEEAIPFLIPEACTVSPGPELRPGQEATFTLAYGAIGREPYPGGLCRSDALYLVEEGEEPFLIWELEEVCALPNEGAATHDTIVPLPEEAPAGAYLMSSSIYDPQNPALPPLKQDFAFTIVGTTTAMARGAR